jgi:hypothetical protein
MAMDQYDIGFEVLGMHLTIRVKAKSMKGAWRKVNTMSVLELLQGKKVKDCGGVYSGSLVGYEKLLAGHARIN